ncbi:hypothetical protein ABPG72_018581 [Tetrahymena utriculariae]
MEEESRQRKQTDFQLGYKKSLLEINETKVNQLMHLESLELVETLFIGRYINTDFQYVEKESKQYYIFETDDEERIIQDVLDNRDLIAANKVLDPKEVSVYKIEKLLNNEGIKDCLESSFQDINLQNKIDLFEFKNIQRESNSAESMTINIEIISN